MTNTEIRLLIVKLNLTTRHKQTAIHCLFTPPVQLNTANFGGTDCSCNKTAFIFRDKYCALSCWESICLSIPAALLISFVIHRISFNFLISSYFLLKRCIYNMVHVFVHFKKTIPNLQKVYMFVVKQKATASKQSLLSILNLNIYLNKSHSDPPYATFIILSRFFAGS